jgi:hypothetical protein
MLRALVSWSGRRAVAVVALLYLAGVIAPSVALAVSDGAMSAYCFEEIAEQVAAAKVQPHVHVHADGTVHVHGGLAAHDEHDQSKGKSHHEHDANCCGAFGFVAVLPDLSAISREARVVSAQTPIASHGLDGCGPARIDRPPILLSTV